MWISEIFTSIQGEGSLLGVPSLFIRTSGCNLRCNWCDTPYTSWKPEGSHMSVDTILSKARQHREQHVVITGGEPMIAKGIHALVSGLACHGRHVTIETAGTIPPENIDCSLASISPKLRNSLPDDRLSPAWRERHERRRIQLDCLRAWIDRGDYQLKFVVTHASDIDEIQELLQTLDRPILAEKVFLMPEGTSQEQLSARQAMLLDLCMTHGYSYTPRLQIELFGNRRGT